MKKRESPEAIRLRYLYRRLVRTGKIRLSIEDARKLIGSDCAYHLYSTEKKSVKKRNNG